MFSFIFFLYFFVFEHSFFIIGFQKYVVNESFPSCVFDKSFSFSLLICLTHSLICVLCCFDRVASMPNTGVEEEYYRLRHFSITGKGVINRGDSLKSRRSRSNTSVASSNSR